MIHLYYHGGSGNHGCEAIIRSTVEMLQQEVVLHTGNSGSDREYGLDKIISLQEDTVKPLPRKSLRFLLFALHHKLTGSDLLYTFFAHRDLFSGVRRGDVYLSVGGDNYCYKGTDILAHYQQWIRSKGAKAVLWGCSVEPELVLKPEIAKDLSRYDLITARETISYKALKAVNPNTVLVADPAFSLDRTDLPLPKGWLEGNTIGINASPLILQSGNSARVLEAYQKLLRHILDTTDCAVALIPHVVLPDSDDRQVLREIHAPFRDSNRVICLDDCNCMELKGYIARCRMFIGARTHATIAAYSSCVPTLVLGYSVKSRGIARDLFGSEEKYVIPVQELSSDEMLAGGFDWLLEHEDRIRAQLQKTMPDYIHKAYIGIEQLKRLTEGD